MYRAKLKEPFAPSWDELVTSVSLAPSDFKISGYAGNMDSWKNFGLFVNTPYARQEHAARCPKAKSA